jgi:hypothetical protein
VGGRLDEAKWDWGKIIGASGLGLLAPPPPDAVLRSKMLCHSLALVDTDSSNRTLSDTVSESSEVTATGLPGGDDDLNRKQQSQEVAVSTFPTTARLYDWLNEHTHTHKTITERSCMHVRK